MKVRKYSGKEKEMKDQDIKVLVRMLMGIVLALMVVITTVSPASAVDTARTYNSGVLVIIFLGVCALIVVAQLVPALLLMLGAIKALASGRRQKEVPVTETNQDGF